jgi:hypothetical protein
MDASPLGAACLMLAIILAAEARLWTQEAGDTARDGFDQVLDARVRDGYVYYRALKADRGPLDRFVGYLARADVPQARDAQVAFWLNAYNALVLRTVVDHYPIAQRTGAFPARSIKQIPGAFEATTHLIAGRKVTLDQIEQSILPSFHDPRVFLALGRGAVGGARLRSEIYSPESLERQLSEQAEECAGRDRCVQIDRAANAVRVSAVFSWRRAEFVEAYARQPEGPFAKRSPSERAIIGFISPHLIAADRDVLSRDQFKVEYLPFDWSLNDLPQRKR